MEEVVRCIISEDSAGLITALSQLNLFKLNETEFIQALEACIRTCYQIQSAEFVVKIFEIFQESNIREENLPLATEILLSSRLEIDEFKFLFDAEKTISQAELLDSLTRWDDSEKVPLACQRIGRIFNTEHISLYEIIYEKAYKNSRSKLTSWLKDKISSMKDELEEPSWVAKVENLPEIEDRRREIDLKEWPNERVVEGIFEFMRDIEGIESDNPEKMKEDIAKIYSLASEEERIKLIEPLAPNYEATDVEIFRVLGPLNAHEELDSEDYICGRFGGCRMLTCRCFVECDESDDLDSISWFKRKCDHCGAKIRRKEFAFRTPLKDGGWEGCFCNSNCCIDSIVEFIKSLLPEKDENKEKIDKERVIKRFVGEIKTAEEGEELDFPIEILRLGLPREKIEELMILIKRVDDVDDELFAKKIWYSNRPHPLILSN